MFRELRIATVLLLALTILTGVVYPLAVTGIAQVVFPRQVQGSLIYDGDQLVGSHLIGQSFTKPGYFWGRLSATAPVPYNAAASSGSNYGPLHPELHKAAAARMAALQADGTTSAKIPIDLVTASGSGLDPHISPAAAEYQVPRVAAARNMSQERVTKLIQEHTETRQWGLFGEPRVNVLELNRALDAIAKNNEQANGR